MGPLKPSPIRAGRQGRAPITHPIHPMKRLQFWGAGLAALLISSIAAFALAPANDDFANAVLLNGASPVSGNNNSATLQSGEPAFVATYDSGNSVWYNWV